MCPDIHLGVVHEELFGQHVPAGVSVKVGMFVQKPGDDVNMNCRVKMLQLLKKNISLKILFDIMAFTLMVSKTRRPFLMIFRLF